MFHARSRLARHRQRQANVDDDKDATNEPVRETGRHYRKVGKKMKQTPGF